MYSDSRELGAEDYSLIIRPKLCMLVGLNEGIFLQQLQYWRNNECTLKNVFNGKRWVINSIEQWLKNFPFWSENTMRRTIKSLKDKAILVTEKNKKYAFSRALMYRIDYDRLNEYHYEVNAPKVEAKEPSSVAGLDLTVLAYKLPMYPKWVDGCTQNGYLSIYTNKILSGEKKLALKTDEKTLHPDREGKEKMNSTAYEVSARALASAKAKKSEVKIPKQPYRIWQHFFRIHFDGKDLVKFVGEDIGKLNHAKKTLGDNFTDVTDCVLGDWRSFGAFALKQKGLTTYPTEPQTGFYLVHCDSALDFYQKSKEVATNDAESASDSGGLVLPSWMDASSLNKGD